MRRLLVFGQRHGVGFILMLVGFLLVGGPLSALAGVLPFLEGLVEAGVFLFLDHGWRRRAGQCERGHDGVTRSFMTS